MIVYTYFNYQGNSKELAEKALEHWLHKPMQVNYDARGKPYVDGIYISISHSANCFVIALSEQCLGIDIEKLKPRNYQAISNKLFKTKNIITLEQFYIAWTAYEALFKAGNNNLKVRYYDIIENFQLAVAGDDNFICLIPLEIII